MAGAQPRPQVRHVPGGPGHRRVADVEADTPVDLELFIRSGIEGGHLDTEFADRLHLRAGCNVATALHTVRPSDGVVASDRFHILLVRLPKRDFALEIRSLRFFVLPAGYGLRSSVMTLSTQP